MITTTPTVNSQSSWLWPLGHVSGVELPPLENLHTCDLQDATLSRVSASLQISPSRSLFFRTFQNISTPASLFFSLETHTRGPFIQSDCFKCMYTSKTSMCTSSSGLSPELQMYPQWMSFLRHLAASKHIDSPIELFYISSLI